MATTKKAQPPAPTKEMKGYAAIKEYLSGKEVMDKYHLLLGKPADWFATYVLSIVANDVNLCLCEPYSICNAVATSVQLNLSLAPAMQLAYISVNSKTELNPASNKIEKRNLAEFAIGWRGLIQLAQRTKEYKTISVTDVREGEIKDRNRLSEDIDFEWVQSAADRNKLPIVGYVSYFKLLSGFEKALYWTMEEIYAHAQKYSETFSKPDGRWKTNEPSMCRKTLLKRLLADYGPTSVEISLAVAADQANVVSLEDGKFEYPDNPEPVAAKAETKSISKAKQAADATLKKLAAKKK